MRNQFGTDLQNSPNFGDIFGADRIDEPFDRDNVHVRLDLRPTFEAVGAGED
jgi:hypothetical protein